LSAVPGRSPRVLLIAVALLAVFIIATALTQTAAFADRTIGILAIVTVLILIAVGTPIAVALLSIGYLGLAFLKRDFGIATDTLSLAAQGTVA